MFRKIYHSLSGKKEAIFESAYSLEESVKRLESVVDPSLISIRAENSAVGRVSKEKVLIKRVTPLIRNSFKPIYVGHFEKNEQNAKLVGYFRMAHSTIFFASIWLIYTAVLFLNEFYYFCTNLEKQTIPTFPINSLAMFGIGLLIIWLGKSQFGEDEKYLSALICNTLSPQEKSPNTP